MCVILMKTPVVKKRVEMEIVHVVCDTIEDLPIPCENWAKGSTAWILNPTQKLLVLDDLGSWVSVEINTK